MTQHAIRQQRAHSRQVLAELTAAFLGLLGAPSETRPTVRCLSRAHARALMIGARAQMDNPELRGFSADSLLDTLVTGGLLIPVGIDTPGRNFAIYRVGQQASDIVDPIELLEAAEPAGVVCYFTALQFYSLTTQVASHHHIARLVRRAPSTMNADEPRLTRTVGDIAAVRRRDPLGTRMFTYQGQPYYRTHRGTHTMAGIQLRRLNDSTIARITTREQTLLDTLHRPLSCGGPSVVWEAWERAVDELDVDTFVDHLRTLNDSRLLRRVGYMLQQQSFSVPTALDELLDRARRAVLQSRDEEPVSLLPGIAGTKCDASWNLRLPGS